MSGTGFFYVYFWVWYWFYHITFICDLGLHVERPAVDICPCWRLGWLFSICRLNFAVLLDRCLVDICSTSRYFSYFTNIKLDKRFRFKMDFFLFYDRKPLLYFQIRAHSFAIYDPCFTLQTMGRCAHDPPLQLFNWIPILKLQFFFNKITL